LESMGSPRAPACAHFAGLGLAAVGLTLLLSGAACGGSSSGIECAPNSTDCQIHGGAGAAAVTAGAAATIWVVGGGCGINGCNLPYACNEDTGFCERLQCDEGRSCPPGFDCDPVRHRCE
jgi:hypothetical protein